MFKSLSLFPHLLINLYKNGHYLSSSDHDTYQLPSLIGNNNPIFTLISSHNIIFSGDEDGYLSIFDSNMIFKKSCKNRLLLHTSAIFDMKIDNNILYSVSGDTKLKLYDLNTLQYISYGQSHVGSIKSIAIGDNNIISTAGRDGSIIIWDIRLPPKYDSDEEADMLCPVIKINYAHGYKENINYFKSKNEYGKCNIEFPNYNNAWSNNIDYNKAFESFTLTKESPLKKRKTSPKLKGSICVTGLSFLHDSHIIAGSSMFDNLVPVWDLRKIGSSPATTLGNNVNNFKGVSSLITNKYNTLLAATSRDNKVYIYDIINLNPEPIMECVGSKIDSFYVRSDFNLSDQLICGSTNGYVNMWDISTKSNLPKVREPLHSIPAGTKIAEDLYTEVNPVAFCESDQLKFVTAGDDAKVRLWKYKPLS